jgi:mRNA-degrading endonuclease RelE of RelBE toxin-antitoxin system
MNYSIELHPKAVEELQDAYQWYEERSQGLGERFLFQLNKRLLEIEETPERYARKKKNYREVGIDVFPYIIIYEILQKEKVVFVSYIFHGKRNPNKKYKR